MATTADIGRGMILKLDGSLYTVVDFGENKTARAAAKVWAKLKGVDNKRSIEKTWNSGENIFPVRVEKKAFQFLYKDDSGFNLMNNETYEQITLAEEMIDAPQCYLLRTRTSWRYGYQGFKTSYSRYRSHSKCAFICRRWGADPHQYKNRGLCGKSKGIIT